MIRRVLSWIFVPDRDDEWKNYVGRREFFEKGADGRSAYHQYLSSDEWRARRKAKLKDAEYHCERCGAVHSKGVQLHVHHRTYKRVTREKLTDLEVLCADCHRREHGR